MEEAIKDFHTQFAWKPTVANTDKLPRARKFILDGMGGSHLAADVLRAYKPELDLLVFSDYGVPALSPARLKDALFIASSFSGNTEEVLDFAEQAFARKLPLAVIAKGGKLLEFARKRALPYVELPPTKIQPRSGLGFQMLALAALIGDKKLIEELGACAKTLRPEEFEGKGEALAGALRGKAPVVYASTRNRAVAYNWKIKFNETGKIPAFYNVIPEMNHNEMTGFDVKENSKSLSALFHVIILKDDSDYERNQKRMHVLKKLYKDRSLPVAEITFVGRTLYEKLFRSLIIADWTALYLAENYGLESEQVPMVEEFKSLVQK